MSASLIWPSCLNHPSPSYLRHSAAVVDRGCCNPIDPPMIDRRPSSLVTPAALSFSLSSFIPSQPYLHIKENLLEEKER
ncbi:hypothetical protein Sjap_005379 [Stephania japonica]|uniref:Uncharacterized protein n=1 Tax=Stephania japonica TaxID=461633 RepID=A0AAP0K455_9MAGN